ncbi:MAG: hypothetical protein EOL87_01890 [Spartobacteria bacterium]|nr:hypothetical protein [Spartobacteria bacterium]
MDIMVKKVFQTVCLCLVVLTGGMFNTSLVTTAAADDDETRMLFDGTAAERIQAARQCRALTAEAMRPYIPSLIAQLGDLTPVPQASHRVNVPMATPSGEAQITLMKAGRAAVPQLIESLRYPDLLVTQRCLDLLSQIGDPSAVPSMMEVLNDRNPMLRDAATRALAVFDAQELPPLAEALELHAESTWVASVIRLYGRGRQVDDMVLLINYLGSPDMLIRNAAMDAMVLAGASAVEELILDVIRRSDQTDLACQSAIRVLARLPGDSAGDALAFMALFSDNGVVRTAAQQAVNASDDAAMEPIQWLLSLTADEGAKPHYVKFGHAQKRLASCLVRLVDVSGEDAVKRKAEWSLLQLGPSAGEAILNRLKSGYDAPQRDELILLLRKLGYDPVSPQDKMIVYALTHNWPALSLQGIQALPVLQLLIVDDDPSVRISVLRLLGQITASPAYELLVYGLRDDDPEVSDVAKSLLLEKQRMIVPQLKEGLLQGDVLFAQRCAALLDLMGYHAFALQERISLAAARQEWDVLSLDLALLSHWIDGLFADARPDQQWQLAWIWRQAAQYASRNPLEVINNPVLIWLVSLLSGQDAVIPVHDVTPWFYASQHSNRKDIRDAGYLLSAHVPASIKNETSENSESDPEMTESAARADGDGENSSDSAAVMWAAMPQSGMDYIVQLRSAEIDGAADALRSLASMILYHANPVADTFDYIDADAVFAGLMSTNAWECTRAAEYIAWTGSADEPMLLQLVHMLADTASFHDPDSGDWVVPGRVAAKTLASLGGAGASALQSALTDDALENDRNAWFGLTLLAVPENTTNLYAVLNSGDAELMLSAIMSLASLKRAEDVPVLLMLSIDGSSRIRRAAHRALVGMGTEFIPLYEQIMAANPLPAVALSMIDILKDMNDPASVNTLLLALKQQDNRSVRVQALTLLSDLAPDVAIPLLVQALGDTHSSVHITALDLLQSIGAPAVYELIRQLDRSDDRKRKRIVRVLESVTGESFGDNKQQWLNWHLECMRSVQGQQ